MEELFCIGCGPKFKQKIKKKQVSHPLALLKKLKKQVSCTVNAVSVFVITMRLWMSTLQMMNFKIAS